MKRKTKSSKINEFNILFVNLQFILTITVFIFFILSFFYSSMFCWLELFLGLSLLMMAYNNQLIYKRKRATIVYFVFGILVLLLDILMFLGVI